MFGHFKISLFFYNYSVDNYFSRVSGEVLSKKLQFYSRPIDSVFESSSSFTKQKGLCSAVGGKTLTFLKLGLSP